jgi:hypothetical protein
MSAGAAVFAAAWVLAGAAAAQTSRAMQATAPEKMMRPGESAAMRDCDKQAMQEHVKMEERARFVKDCVAQAMKPK